MKKNLLFAFLFSVVYFPAKLSAQNGTCVPSIAVDCVTVPNYIDTATTTFAATNFTNNGTDCNTQDQNYADYQNKIASEMAGGSFNLHVGLNQSLPAYLGVWVDWNDDLVFGSGEQVYLSASPVVMANIAVNVPINAVDDTLILRIRCGPVSMGPCDSLGAGETEDYRLIILDATGINSFSENFTWNISPNPANDFLNIDLGENVAQAEIAIVDLLGNIVYSVNTNNGKSVMDVSALARGIYFVRVNVNGKSSVKKFVH